LSNIFDHSRNGILTANILGVGLASFFIVAMERGGSESLRHFLLPGFCGGLTTFSSVMLFTTRSEVDTSYPYSGSEYLGATLIFSVTVVAICIPLARKLIPVKK
jgi:CrcB protein